MKWVIVTLLALGPFDGDVVTASGYHLDPASPVFSTKHTCKLVASMANGMERVRRNRPPDGAGPDSVKLWKVGTSLYKRMSLCVPEGAIGIDYLETLVRVEGDLEAWGLKDDFNSTLARQASR